MSIARLLVGDVRDRLAELPDGSVDLIVTSPPYLALRSYLPKDHPLKAKEIGSEPDPATFIDVLLALTAEFRRVLAPYGSICVELGDTYSGSGGAGGDYGPVGLRSGQPEFDGSAARTRSNRPGQYGTDTGPPRRQITTAWPLAKSRTLIPELYRVALAYNLNPLTGQPSPAGRWRVRQVHYHARPNPPVGALGDKFRPSVSEWVIACTSAKRWFDLDAVRGGTYAHPERIGKPINNGRGDTYGDDVASSWSNKPDFMIEDRGGPPPLDHSWLDWDDWFPAAQRTPTTPYPGAHYATFGPAVIRPFIEAMCPIQVCTECGEPRRRIVADNEELAAAKAAVGDKWKSGGLERGMKRPKGADRIDVPGGGPTLGWTDCGHESWRNGIVLDPFVGSGTTLEVATGCGRDALGIDIDERNIDLIRQRCGMFLTEVDEKPVPLDWRIHNTEEAARAAASLNPKIRAGTPRWDRPAGERTKDYP